jgi:predicted MPP superfamily phosphohydrolase
MAITRRELLTGMVAAGVGLPRMAEAENRQEHFGVTRTELAVAGLDPAHDGLVVAHLSDIHVGRGTPDERLIAAVGEVNAAKPDLILLTGDYVTWTAKVIPHIPRVLGGLQAPVFSVLGNHDHYVNAPAVRGELEKMGYAVLQNEHTVARVRGADLTIVGIDDGTTHRDDVGSSLKGVSLGRGSRLVLAHAPRTFDRLPADSGLACFSGHTHGGQIQVPGVTPTLFRMVGERYVRGAYAGRGNQLYVSRGLGFGGGGWPPRIGSDPEVGFFTLRAAP